MFFANDQKFHSEQKNYCRICGFVLIDEESHLGAA